MPGFVLHHVCVNCAPQWLSSQVANSTECGKGQPLNDDLHSQISQVPSGISDRLVQQSLEVWVDRIENSQFFPQVPRKHFDVPRFIKDLSRGIKLRVDVRNRLHDLG